MAKARLKPVVWLGNSKAELQQLSEQVQEDVGSALFVAQSGLMPSAAKVLKGFGGAGVL